jgi:N-acetyl-gamma-glutamyl-phosphate reductase
MTLRVAIAGASGYAGGEVARLLEGHPEFELATLTAHSAAGQSVESVHPHLSTLHGRTFEKTTLDVLSGHDVVVIALPHGDSGALGEELLAQGGQKLIVDLGADRRLESTADWDAFYGGTHYAPFTYAMPELVRASGPSSRDLISSSSALAAPGCNATAITVALVPLLARGIIEPHDLSAVLAVGSSGAGKTPRADLMGADLQGSANPYAVGGIHRHLPEIRQNIRAATGHDSALSMTPVLVPMSRGILATCSGIRSGKHSAADIHRELIDAYRDEPFVSVLPLGQFPRTGDVVGSNQVHLGVALDESVNRVVVISALDNLVKGTAGAALQSMNLALGFEETAGLTSNGVAP